MVDLRRTLERSLSDALESFRAVAVVGARQVGKSTLVRALPGRHYVTLDDVGALAAAANDPRGFVTALPHPCTIDEVQRVPALLLAVKETLDRERARGTFLLTGSSHLDTLRGLKESLAGRAALLELHPLTWQEMLEVPFASPLDRLFACADVRDAAHAYGGLTPARAPSGDDVLAGGFPEPVLHVQAKARHAWLREYARTYVQRDVGELTRIEDTPLFLRFVVACAASSSVLLNLSELARDLGISVDTARRWVGLLEATFVARRRMPYWRNIKKRLVKSPKLFLADSGLMAALLGIQDWRAAQAAGVDGALLETWVHQQLDALVSSSERPTELFFYRTHAQVEVDFLVVRGARAIPIEVKAGKTVSPRDAKGVESFVAQHPQRARFGLVLYGGEGVYPLREHTLAVPLGTFLAP